MKVKKNREVYVCRECDTIPFSVNTLSYIKPVLLLDSPTATDSYLCTCMLLTFRAVTVVSSQQKGTLTKNGQNTSFYTRIKWTCRSEWTRGLRYEPPTLPRTLWSWFESHSRHGCLYCVRLSCFCVVLFVGRSLTTAWSPVQGVLPSVYRIMKLKKRPRPNKGL
jgi:hypothetical protein